VRVAEAQGEVAAAAPGKTQNEPWYVSSYAIICVVIAVDHGAVAARYTSWRGHRRRLVPDRRGGPVAPAFIVFLILTDAPILITPVVQSVRDERRIGVW
jgi:hypothetical protein